MNLTNFLETSAINFPDKTAVRFEGQGVAYAELNVSCNRLAAGLQNMGLSAGDCCALMMPNNIHAMVAYNALAKLGAVIVPINFMYREHELKHIFTDSKPRAFIGAAPYLDEVSKVLSTSDETPIRLALGGSDDGAFVKERVAPYKYPRIINITREPLPKSGTGKILKKEIRKKYTNENG